MHSAKKWAHAVLALNFLWCFLRKKEGTWHLQEAAGLSVQSKVRDRNSVLSGPAVQLYITV